MALGQDVEIQRLDGAIGADPLRHRVLVKRPAGAGQRAHRGGHQGVGGEVGGEHHPLGREIDHRAVVRVVLAGEDQLQGRAAERQGHGVRIGDVGRHDIGEILGRGDVAVAVAVLVREPEVGHAADPGVLGARIVDLVQLDSAVGILVDHVTGHVRVSAVHVLAHAVLGDEQGRVAERGAAFDMVPVAVAVDHVADRHARIAFGQLGLQPLGEFHADRVDEDDPRLGDREQRPPVAVAGPEDVIGDLLYDSRRRRRGPGRTAGLGRGGHGRGGERKRQHTGLQYAGQWRSPFAASGEA